MMHSVIHSTACENKYMLKCLKMQVFMLLANAAGK